MEYNTVLTELQISPEVKEVEVESLYERLQRVRDQRCRRGKRYTSAVVLTLIIVAKLAGETKLSGIAEWVGLRREELAKRLPLRKSQAPCANTYRYVCAHVDVAEVNEVLGQYFAEINRGVASEPAPGGIPPVTTTVEPAPLTHLALDGKSLRGTRRRGEAIKVAVHRVPGGAVCIM